MRLARGQRACCERTREPRDARAERPRDGGLVLRQRRVPRSREVRGAVWRTARARLEQRRLRVRHADDQHAVMQQRQLHAEQRAFLAAVCATSST